MQTSGTTQYGSGEFGIPDEHDGPLHAPRASTTQKIAIPLGELRPVTSPAGASSGTPPSVIGGMGGITPSAVMSPTTETSATNARTSSSSSMTMIEEHKGSQSFTGQIPRSVKSNQTGESTVSSAVPAPMDFKNVVTLKFKKLVESGMSPNEAATQAITVVKADVTSKIKELTDQGMGTDDATAKAIEAVAEAVAES